MAIPKRKQVTKRQRKQRRASPAVKSGTATKSISVYQGISEAMKWCTSIGIAMRSYVSPTNGKRPCIVLDIDQTIVYGNGQPIHAVIEFAKKMVLSAGYKLYLITARPLFPQNYEWTVQQLFSHRFVKRSDLHRLVPAHQVKTYIPYEQLYMLPQSMQQLSKVQGFSLYKYICRKKIIQEDILINVGDQWDDLILRPAQTPQHHYIHERLYAIETQASQHRRSNLNGHHGEGPVIIGVNVSPCSLISVKLPSY